MAQTRTEVLSVQTSGRGYSRRTRCPVCRGEHERGKTCDRCGYEPVAVRYAQESQGVLKELQGFISNPWGATALILGVILPFTLSIILGVMILIPLLARTPVDERLFNLALLFLIFLIWASIVDQGIILFVYFMRDQLYKYHWSWPVQTGHRPTVVSLAGVALVLFLLQGLFTALLPMVWSVSAPSVETFGVAAQDFWRSVLLAFLLSMSFASFVLFLMLLDAADYIAKRDQDSMPPIYMDINKLLKVVLDTVHDYLDVPDSTILSLQRTKSGGLQLLVKVPLPLPGQGQPPAQPQPPAPAQPPAQGQPPAQPQYALYDVESDKWGFLVNLKEKRG
ncbi:MAG: hypothetical protein KKA73_04720 [Chloroflexi bacterium]|nr:hypothetical protein [Chloroflexota bacterium]